MSDPREGAIRMSCRSFVHVYIPVHVPELADREREREPLRCERERFRTEARLRRAAAGVAQSAGSRPGMGGVVGFFHAFGADVGVNLGGGKTRMAQQLLHTAQVRAGIQHVRGKGMPQRMR